jgi:hypothetical protein
MGGLDIIITSDSSQAPPVWDSWIFKSNIDGFSNLILMDLMY